MVAIVDLLTWMICATKTFMPVNDSEAITCWYTDDLYSMNFNLPRLHLSTFTVLILYIGLLSVGIRGIQSIIITVYKSVRRKYVHSSSTVLYVHLGVSHRKGSLVYSTLRYIQVDCTLQSHFDNGINERWVSFKRSKLTRKRKVCQDGRAV